MVFDNVLALFGYDSRLEDKAFCMTGGGGKSAMTDQQLVAQERFNREAVLDTQLFFTLIEPLLKVPRRKSKPLPQSGMEKDVRRTHKLVVGNQHAIERIALRVDAVLAEMGLQPPASPKFVRRTSLQLEQRVHAALGS